MSKLIDNSVGLPWSAPAAQYFKVSGQSCPHALALIQPKPDDKGKSPAPFLACPVCKYRLDPDDEVSLVRATQVQFAKAKAKDLAK